MNNNGKNSLRANFGVLESSLRNTLDHPGRHSNAHGAHAGVEFRRCGRRSQCGSIAAGRSVAQNSLQTHVSIEVWKQTEKASVQWSMQR